MHRMTLVALAAVLGTGMLLTPRLATGGQWNATVARSDVTIPEMEMKIPGDYRGTSPGNHLSAEISAPLREDSGRAADFELWLVGTFDGRSWTRDAAVLRIQNTGSGYTLGYLPTDDTHAGNVPGRGRESCEGPLSATGSAISAKVATTAGCQGVFPGARGDWTVSFSGNRIRIQSASGQPMLTFRKVS